MVNFALEPSRTALLIVDMQNVFVENSPVAAPAGLDVLGRLNRLAATCHEAGIDVIYTAHVIRPDHSNLGLLGEILPPVEAGLIDDGSNSGALHPALRPDRGDIVLKKPRYGAFHSTDLELILRHRGIDTLIIGGIATNVCCETTAREAVMRDFKVVFLTDGTATFGLPDVGFGPISAEEMQSVTCSVIGFFFGQVLTVDQVIERIRRGVVNHPSWRIA
jgi:ureidoacrylate peracid hydrolase